MEGNGRKLAWIAIALSALALFVSVSGRMHTRMDRSMAMQGFAGRHGQMAPQAPQGQFAPQAPQPPQGWQQQGPAGPRGGFGQQGRMGNRMSFFFMPFMLIGGLMKAAFFIVLIWLGIRLIRGRGFGRPGGRHDQQHTPAGAAEQSPGPEQPPYTGDTRQI
ncbi:MAG: hypothetical protein U0Z44_02545 [Kouleothrix sp.]